MCEGFQLLVHLCLAICARHMISASGVQPDAARCFAHRGTCVRSAEAHPHTATSSPGRHGPSPTIQPYEPPQMSVSFSQKLALIMVCSLRWRLASHAEFPLNLLLPLEQALCIRAVLGAASFLLVLAVCSAAAAAPLLPAVHARSRVGHLLSSGRPYAARGEPRTWGA